MWRYFALATLLPGVVQAAKKPNILFVLTDDQDAHMGSLEHMPMVQKYLVDEGTQYMKHYCTVAICCPSRVNIWTGRAAHNTNVTDLSPPYGGYLKFIEEGLNDNYLPVWLQDIGYNTYYTGKLFNHHSVNTYDKPYVAGFNDSDFLLDPHTYEYYNSVMTRNGEKPVSYKDRYSPDVIAEKGLGFLEEAIGHDEPFFLAIAPIAPHSNVRFVEGGVEFGLPQYAPRHAELFKDYKIPRTPNFNPDEPSGVSWVSRLPKLNESLVEYHDEYQRSRLRSLQSVDEMVETLVKKLEAKGELDNTYIIYSTDNGFHIGQHRLPPGKTCPFETDINIPLIIRGPGVPAGHKAELVSSHSDIAPTILKLAGGERLDFDGKPIALSSDSMSSLEVGEHVSVEFWGHGVLEGEEGNDHVSGPLTNTYKALRIVGQGYSLLYTVWCTGEKEYYDLSTDPDQVINYLSTRSAHLQSDYMLSGRNFDEVIKRMDALLMVLKSCKADSCREPWKTLHPDGDIETLEDALNSTYDRFYEEQPKVAFASCQMGYIKSEEGPHDVHVWEQENYKFVDQSQWSWWT